VVRVLADILSPFLEPLPAAAQTDPATQDNIKKMKTRHRGETKQSGMIFEIIPTTKRRN
jgi:hypothetical protein